MEKDDLLQYPSAAKVCFWLKVLFIIALSSFFKSANAQNVDSLVKILEKRIIHVKSDTCHIDLLLQLGQLYSDRVPAQEEEALSIEQQALSLSRKLGSFEWQNKCLLQIAIQDGILKKYIESRQAYLEVLRYWYDRHNLKQVLSTLEYIQFGMRWGANRNKGMLQESIYCLQQERTIYIKSGDKLNAILCLKNEGDDNLVMGNLNVAEKELLEVQQQLIAIHYRDLRDTRYLLSAVCHLKGQLNKELYYCIEVVKEAQADNDTVSLPLFYVKLASVYEDLNMYENSLVFYNKVFSIKSLNVQYISYKTYSPICRVLIKLNKPLEALHLLQNIELKDPPKDGEQKASLCRGLASCYIALKNNSLAEFYLLKMIKTEDYDISLFASNLETRFLDNMEVCKFYVTRKDYTRANYYLQKTLEVPQFNISAIDRSEAEMLQFKLDSAHGNFISSIKHFERYKKMTDSIFNVKESDEVANIQTKYETERKDKNILLLKKQSIIDRQEYSRKRSIGNLLIAVVILLMILLTVLYSRYLLKQRNVIVLQEKQKEISIKNHTLEKLLHENEWLIKEVHHRVKNNLHIITSLLHTQSAYLKDETALSAVLDSQHRVNAMSLIHQKLYKSANGTSIYMPEYIAELVDYLKESFKTGLGILFTLEIEPVMLDVIHAIPVGLILNEVITNAVKYAFPFSRDDSIFIKLSQINESYIQLTVSDNGRGLPQDFDINKSTSFGMTLIQGLIDDLSGTFLLKNCMGTTVTINFNILQRDERIITTGH